MKYGKGFSLLLVGMLVFVGCGGSDSSSTVTETTDESSVEKGTGTYIDSVVSGVSYVCGTEEGITGDDGSFTYDLNSSCTFTLNGVELRVVDRSELRNSTIEVFEDDIAVARLLQSLDEDGNASNGITISTEILAALSENNISTLPSSFEEVEAIVEVLKSSELLSTSIFRSQGRAKSDADVARHLSSTRGGLRGTDTTAPIITVIGDNPLAILLGKTYTDLGANARDRIDGRLDTNSSGSVDTATLGTYIITYTATDDSNNSSTATRTVEVNEVGDVTAPIIRVFGDENITVLSGITYRDRGARAFDGVDGSVDANGSGSVDTSTLGTYTITYTATDLSGNSATETRTVTVVENTDTTGPVITLRGDSSLTLAEGTTYTESGARARDAVDGRVDVTISGTVDTSTLGTYTVTYTATDETANSTTATRTVSVVALSDISSFTKSELGELFFNDTSFSLTRTQSCATCHNPDQAFIDTRSNSVSGAVSLGDNNSSLGDRNTPMITYSSFSPTFAERGNGFVGGQFFDGRAADLVEQAKHPFLNPVEMQMPDVASVIERINENETYVEQLKALYGSTVFDDNDTAFTAMADAIATFESSSIFAAFDSKFDTSGRGRRATTELTDEEREGQRLFRQNRCTSCHRDRGGNSLFTNFEYENIGIPKNEAVRALNGKQSEFVDLGLSDNPNIDDDNQDGKFKVPSLRNIAVTAPYMHNGKFQNLATVVHFYNTRDVSGAINPETGLVWESAEVEDNKVAGNRVGNLGLSDAEEAAIVAFLETLTDNRYESLIP